MANSTLSHWAQYWVEAIARPRDEYPEAYAAGERMEIEFVYNSIPEHLEALAELIRAKRIVVLGGKIKVDVTVHYQTYLQSPEWAIKRNEARERAGHRCQVCNSPNGPLDTHHRTYDRLGRELPEDLIVLCRSCHDLFHKNGRVAS